MSFYKLDFSRNLSFSSIYIFKFLGIMFIILFWYSNCQSKESVSSVPFPFLKLLYCMFFYQFMCAESFPTLCGPREFSRQDNWSGLPFSTPGDLPNPGIEPMSPALTGGFFTAELPGKPYGFNLWLQVRCKNIDLFFHI